MELHPAQVLHSSKREPKARANGAAACCSEMQSQGEMEYDTMAKDDRDILELLKEELAFVEQGGYGRSVRTPWLRSNSFASCRRAVETCRPNRGSWDSIVEFP